MIALQEEELQGKKVVEIKKVGVLSVAKICAFLYLIPGVIIGIYIGTEYGRYSPMLSGTILSWIYRRVSFILFPIMYGTGGFLFGLLGGLFYNFLSRKIGGIEIEIE